MYVGLWNFVLSAFQNVMFADLDRQFDSVGEYDPNDNSLTWSNTTLVRFQGKHFHGNPMKPTNGPVVLLNPLKPHTLTILPLL